MTAKTKLPGLMYTRQSRGNPKSIKDQDSIGRRRFQLEDWNLLGVFSDKVSASRNATRVRNDWPKLFETVLTGVVDDGVIWLWEASRGDRDVETWVGFLARCRERRIKLYIESDGEGYLYDLTQPREYKAMVLAGADSEYESEMTKLRINRDKSQLRRAALAGELDRPDGGLKAILGGRARYGWRDPGIKQPWELEPNAAAVLQETAQRLLAGEELMSIYRDMIDRHGELRDSYSDSLPINYDRLNDTLHMPVTGGMLSNGKGRILGQVAQGPVDGKTYKQLHAMFTARPKGRYGTNEYPLGKLLRCHCGNQLTGELSDNGKQRYYACRNQHKDAKTGAVILPCGRTFIRVADVHDHVAQALQRWAKTSPRARQLIDATVDVGPQRAALNEEWEKLRTRMTRLERKLRTNRIEQEEFEQSEAFIEERFAEIELELAALDKAEEDPLPVSFDWHQMSSAGKRKWVSEAFVTPIVVQRPAKPGPYQQVGDRLNLRVRT